MEQEHSRHRSIAPNYGSDGSYRFGTTQQGAA